MRSLAAIAIVVWANGLSSGTAQASPLTLTQETASNLREAAFTPSNSVAEPAPQDDVIGRLLDLANPSPPQFQWRDDYLAHAVAVGGETVDTLRITYGRTAGVNDLVAVDPANRDYEVRLTRDWPGAFSLRGERYGVDLTPHAGFGFSNRGNSAEAGATLTFGRNFPGDKIGLHPGIFNLF